MLPPDLAARVPADLPQRIQQLTREHPDRERIAKAAGGFPVFEAWDSWVVLRPHGEVAYFDVSSGRVGREDDPGSLRWTYVQIAQRCALLAELMPVPDAAAVTCSACSGSGDAVDVIAAEGALTAEERASIPRSYPPVFVCGSCHGLGWNGAQNPAT